MRGSNKIEWDGTWNYEQLMNGKNGLNGNNATHWKVSVGKGEKSRRYNGVRA